MHVATLIAADRLDPAFVDALRNAWGGGDAVWLDPARAAEFAMEHRPGNLWEVWADAQTLGTIDTVEGESVVLALAGETPQKITLGKDMFALDNSGSVIVLATLAQIEAAIPSEG